MYGGYRANLVAYSIAKLSHATGQRVDLAAIRSRQGLDADLEEAIVDLSRLAWRTLVDETPAGANLTEWAKRDQCWKAMRDQAWTVPAGVAARLVPLGRNANSGATPVASDDPVVAELSADVWFSLAKWAKQTNNLHPWGAEARLRHRHPCESG